MAKIILVCLLFFGIGGVISYLISLFTKKRYIKYIPAIIPLYFALISLKDSMTVTEGFADIANFLSFILFTASLLGMIIIGIVIDKKRK